MIRKRDIKALTKIVGVENIYSDKAHRLAYSYDATRTRYEPDLVIFPRDESDISAILSYCNQNGISVTPRGAREWLYRRLSTS